LKDSGTVAPAKKLIDELAKSMDQLASDPLPQQVDNDKVKEMIAILKANTHDLAKEIHGGAEDDVIKEDLELLHGSFHKLMEAWSADEEHEHEEESHEHQ
jgi:hypothetical protein